MNGNQKKMSELIETYDLYEIVKVPFPFSDRANTKKRPVLILSEAKHFNAKNGCSIMAMITSLKPSRLTWPTDIVIKNLESAGLPSPSLIRFKLFTLDHRLIIGRLGYLSKKDSDEVQKTLAAILSMLP